MWEPSRHHHLTVLAAAYAVTAEERYAHRVADHLKSWWAANPPMRGVHWISGIELGIRLLSWVWVRRLLDGWPGAAALFEDNPEAVHQILHHQRWLAAFPSRGSSANNHLVAELAGQVAASSAFPWFPESRRWRGRTLRSLDVALQRNTFGSGLNRELATEYHGLVMELALAAAAEAHAAGASGSGVDLGGAGPDGRRARRDRRRAGCDRRGRATRTTGKASSSTATPPIGGARCSPPARPSSVDRRGGRRVPTATSERSRWPRSRARTRPSDNDPPPAPPSWPTPA